MAWNRTLAFGAITALALGAVGTVTHAQAGSVQLPPESGDFDYQIFGRYPANERVKIVSSNAGIRADPSISEAIPDAPLDPNVYNICYVNAFQTQVDDNDFWLTQHNDLILKQGDTPLEDTRWPGELLFDISTESKRAELLAIERRWLMHCREQGFQAIEPDNIDSYERSNGLIQPEAALAFAQQIAIAAHDLGLAVAQKNSAEWSLPLEEGAETWSTAAGFDFAIVEECQLTNECDALIAHFGASRVLDIEYLYSTRDTSSGVPVEPETRDHFDAACAARGNQIRIVFRDREVRPAGEDGHVFDLCGLRSDDDTAEPGDDDDDDGRVAPAEDDDDEAASGRDEEEEAEQSPTGRDENSEGGPDDGTEEDDE
jgi:hypothetical protein